MGEKKGKQSTVGLKEGIGERPKEKKDRDDEWRRKIETKLLCKKGRRKEGKNRSKRGKAKEDQRFNLIQCVLLCNYIHLM